MLPRFYRPVTAILLTLGWIFSAALPARGADFRVGLALDKGGRDDQSFNAAAYRGSQEAEKSLGVKVKVLEGRDDSSEVLLRSLAEKKFDLIIAVGVNQAEAIKRVAAQFPERRFVLIDAEVTAPNVKSVVFEEHQGAFLVGAIAALVSKTGKVGFVGGMDIPLIRRFQMGYEAGAKHVKKSTQVVSNFAGVTGDAWNNPAKGKELALAQYGAGADIIFAAAGATGMGVFDAAEEKKAFAIGVDSNQNGIKPGRILTSMLKRVDLAVLKVIEEAKAGKFGAGTDRRGIAADGIDFAVDAHNQAILPKDVIARVNGFKTDIISGKIVVPDYYKQGKSR